MTDLLDFSYFVPEINSITFILSLRDTYLIKFIMFNLFFIRQMTNLNGIKRDLNVSRMVNHLFFKYTHH